MELGAFLSPDERIEQRDKIQNALALKLTVCMICQVKLIVLEDYMKILLDNETPGFQFESVLALSVRMSGLGKTFISRNLFKNDNWSHYSVDYEIGKLLVKEQTSKIN